MAVPIWKRMLKWLLWLVGGTLTLAVVAYLVLLVINWHDVPPSESARRLEAVYRNRPAAADADNGYVYVMGFSVAPNADPQVAGARRVAWIRNLSPGGHFSAADDPASGDTSYRSNRPPVAKQISDACQAGSADCALAFEHGEDALREWGNSEQWLLDRYVALLHRPAWVEAVPIDIRAPLPAYGTVLDGQRLLFVEAYLLAKEKNAAAVRDLLGDDVRFWRHVLASSDILITKMIAVAALHRHFALGNVVLRRLPPEMELQGMPQEWTAPLTDEERSMLRTFTGEWIFGNSILQESLPSGSWSAIVQFNTEDRFVDKLAGRLLMPFYQPQETSNRRAEMFVRASEAMQVPFSELRQGLKQARATFEQTGRSVAPFTRLYNPMGDLLMAMDSNVFSPYGARVADVEGSRRAALLTATLRNRKVDAQKISAELASSEIRAPYDGKPFVWDIGEQAIVFVGLDPSARGRHAFKY